MINKVILIGNLGRDPEVRRLDNGSAVGKFTIATNENWRDKSGEWQTSTEWHNIVVWRHNAERAEKQLKKGSQVYIEGKLTHRSYKDQDGNDKYITEVVANILRTLDKREGGEGGFNTNFPTEESPAKTVDSPSPAASNVPGPDDDLPF